MVSMNGTSGASTGHLRVLDLRSAGRASANAWRTIRRCTPSLRATPLMLPTPNSYYLRICSNSSTFALLSIPSHLLHQEGWARLGGGGPIQSIEIRYDP